MLCLLGLRGRALPFEKITPLSSPNINGFLGKLLPWALVVAAETFSHFVGQGRAAPGVFFIFVFF